MTDFHYTTRDSWKAISSQTVWVFKGGQPPIPDSHPFGAYFTTLPVGTPRLAKLLRLPARKVECFFSFRDVGDLHPLRGGRGDFIFVSYTDYPVAEERQLAHGARQDFPGGEA
jgi:hypothetical protein